LGFLIVLMVILILLGIAVVVISIEAIAKIRKENSNRGQEVVTVVTQTESKVDRLGQAVVSFIFSFLSLLLLILLFSVVRGSSRSMNYSNSYTVSDESVIAFSIVLGLFLCFNLLSIIFGIRARKSISGRGLAVAGLTISIIILTVPIAFVIFGVILSANFSKGI